MTFRSNEPLCVRRLADDGVATLGSLCVFGHHVCSTLEDTHRDVKVMHQTRIPAGRYRITLRKFGGFHNRYSERFSEIHAGMLHLHDVPGFTDILIHVGNFHGDTSGCILLGERASKDANGNYSVSNSVASYVKVYPLIRYMIWNKLVTHIAVRDETP